jgi:Protein of unknown function (DUF3800)
MMTLYCDESDDGETYALAGWLATPSAWERFDLAWRAMLETIRMPDGSPCKAFHTREIVNRDLIPNSPFRGWTFADEPAAFTKAIDVICDKSHCAIMWPFGVAAEIPRTFTGIKRDSIWLLLFTNFARMINQTYTAQRSISFVFDEKRELEGGAAFIHDVIKKALNDIAPNTLEGPPIFATDDDEPGLQAADLMAYEWRKRISDARQKPEKAVRKSYARIREVRNEGALWRFGRELVDNAVGDEQALAKVFWAVASGPPTHHD